MAQYFTFSNLSYIDHRNWWGLIHVYVCSPNMLSMGCNQRFLVSLKVA